jgi:uncharacterized protein YciI
MTPAPEPDPLGVFIVERPTGDKWIPGRGPREQPLWDEHAEFIDALFDEGAIVLGGPLADGSGAVLVIEATDEHEVRRLLAGDPWIVDADVLRVGDVREWHLFIDARRGA